jgi:hypothetical protein
MSSKGDKLQRLRPSMKFQKYLILSVFVISSIQSSAQLKLVPGEKFLLGLAVRKVFVAVEDHLV